jgi:hypothetical protein
MLHMQLRTDKARHSKIISAKRGCYCLSHAGVKSQSQTGVCSKKRDKLRQIALYKRHASTELCLNPWLGRLRGIDHNEGFGMTLKSKAAAWAAAFCVLGAPATASAEVYLSVEVEPPALPEYEQPEVPGPGYIWTPGYWSYGDEGYYWVPGAWVEAPEPGLLWTPGYWGWSDGHYHWNGGYWGEHIGYYGGVSYGYGYTGVGYYGGRWSEGVFVYNASVTHVNVTIIHNTYHETVNVTHTTNVSYNGGAHGVTVKPTHAEETASRERHIQPTQHQLDHHQTASKNREQLATVNHGKPGVAATSKPGNFTGPGVTTAHNGGGAGQTHNGGAHQTGGGGQAHNGGPDRFHQGANNSPSGSGGPAPRQGGSTSHLGGGGAGGNHAASPGGHQRPTGSAAGQGGRGGASPHASHQGAGQQMGGNSHAGGRQGSGSGGAPHSGGASHGGNGQMAQHGGGMHSGGASHGAMGGGRPGGGIHGAMGGGGIHGAMGGRPAGGGAPHGATGGRPPQHAAPQQKKPKL